MGGWQLKVNCALQIQVVSAGSFHCECAMPVCMLQIHSCGYALCMHAHTHAHRMRALEHS